MKIAFVCDTPYQILNASNLYWSEYKGKEGVSSDLYIVDQFRNAQEIFNKISAADLFNNVYLIRREENRFMPQGLKRSIRVAYSYLNPRHAVRNQFDGKIPVKKYDFIFAALMKCFTAALLKLNPDADFMLFDDGTGSYSSDLVANGGGLAYRLFSKITGCGANTARAKKLFVNNPSMCHSTAADEICKIQPFSDEFLNLAYEIFGVEKQNSKFSGIILLTQPADTKIHDINMQAMVDGARAYCDRVLVRMHPRDYAFERYEGFPVDGKGELWELKISQFDMENTMLFASFSTAQLTPKQFFDKEPWLLFSYRALEIVNEVAAEGYDKIVDQLRTTYREPHRIMVPQSKEELNQCIESFINKQ